MAEIPVGHQEDKENGQILVSYVSQFWDEEERCFFEFEEDTLGLMDEIPEEERLYQVIALNDAFDHFAMVADDQYTYPNTDEGKTAHEEEVTFKHKQNIQLAQYLVSLGWEPDIDFAIFNPELAQEVFPEIYEKAQKWSQGEQNDL